MKNDMSTMINILNTMMKGCIFVDLMVNMGSKALYVHVQFFIGCGSLILKKKTIT